MKLAKSLLLGSAAGLCAVAGVAQAADLPMRKAAPVEYVRVCTAFGAGFFFIPGTDTCLRISGRARFEYQYTSQRNARDVSGFRAIGRLAADARTQTAYGALRTFIRFDIMSRSGAYLSSGTAQRYALAFPGLGQDTFGRTQKHVDIDKAFVQFAGITAGRAASFFDFYAADAEMIGANIVSNQGSTNLLAYTATFGNGFSATISAEDPIFRRNPVYSPFAAAAFGSAAVSGASFLPTGSAAVTLGSSAFSAISIQNGVANNFAFVDVVQRSRLPDFVGALRVDQAWGSAQVMGAVHEIALGGVSTASQATGTPAGVISPSGVFGPATARGYDQTEYGFAVAGGLKLNVPQLAPGDTLWLQAAYAQGASHYTGLFSPQGQELQNSAYTGRSQFGGVDSALDINGRQHLTETYSFNAAFIHYFTPELRTGIFGSYGRVHFDSALRGAASPLVGGFTTAANNFGIFNPTFKDYTNVYVGGNLIYSPVRDFDVGVEVVYERLEFLGGASGGRVADLNKFPTQVNSANPFRTIKVDDNILVRMRVQRDF